VPNPQPFFIEDLFPKQSNLKRKTSKNIDQRTSIIFEALLFLSILHSLQIEKKVWNLQNMK